MDPDTPTYMLGWARNTEDPEEEVDKMPLLLNPKPGKHSDVADRHRTYADPKKENYLKMMAFLRTHVVGEFLIFGDMVRPATIRPNEIVKYDYNFFWSLRKITEHAGKFGGAAFISSGWVKAFNNPSDEADDTAVYIVANATEEKRANIEVVIDLDGVFPGRVVSYQTMRIVPNIIQRMEDCRFGKEALAEEEIVLVENFEPLEVFIIKVEKKGVNNGHR